ncbi:hypothetical protein DMENIID0001_060550 [Sergentomyia squamirostris]
MWGIYDHSPLTDDTDDHRDDLTVQMTSANFIEELKNMEALMERNWELTIPLRHQSLASTPWEVLMMLGFSANLHCAKN